VFSLLTVIIHQLFVKSYHFLFFSKAFDKVSHEKLALKLYDYGIRGPALKWVKWFLDNRHQSVIVNGCSSQTYTCLIWST